MPMTLAQMLDRPRLAILDNCLCRLRGGQVEAVFAAGGWEERKHPRAAENTAGKYKPGQFVPKNAGAQATKAGTAKPTAPTGKDDDLATIIPGPESRPEGEAIPPKPATDPKDIATKALAAMTDKARRAKLAATYVGREIQRYAEEHNEVKFSHAIKGVSLRDNEPVDIICHDAGGQIQHGIELKTIVRNKAAKITMHGDAMERKREWMKKNHADFHTVVLDDTAVFNAKGPGKHDESKRRILYRRGFGSFRVGNMYEVKDIAELRRLMETPTKQLPEAAQPSTDYPKVRRR